MTDEMKKHAASMYDPVFRLRRPLYGWSRSGNIWEKHLAQTLMELDIQTERNFFDKLDAIKRDGRWTPVPDWPQTFTKRNPKGRIIMLTVYVDDFIMAGPDHHLEWDAIRSKIKITDPTPVDRVLGVHHTFKKVDKTKSEVVLDMKAYTDQALNMYNAVPNAPPLKPNVQYPWYEPSIVEVSELSSKPGVVQHCAASFLMKLLYMGRMVRV